MADASERRWVVGRFLSSRVAQRIFFLMLLSALVPILSFALLSFQQVTRQLESDAAARLQQDSKQLGMAVLERLLLLEARGRVALELPRHLLEREQREAEDRDQRADEHQEEDAPRDAASEEAADHPALFVAI